MCAMLSEIFEDRFERSLSDRVKESRLGSETLLEMEPGFLKLVVLDTGFFVMGLFVEWVFFSHGIRFEIGMAFFKHTSNVIGRLLIYHCGLADDPSYGLTVSLPVTSLL